MPTMLPVFETFTSIQGESTHAGRICFFIRLAGCNLRCNYCDTTYAFSGGSEYTMAEITAMAENSPCKLVEITGGEPLLHPETPLLAEMLLQKGFEVLIETNGSLDIGVLPPGCRRIVDYKLPSSGMAENMYRGNWTKLTAFDEVKFVTGSREDFDFAIMRIKEFQLAKQTPNLIFSPVWGKVELPELARWVVECGIPECRMQLQLHKVIWGDKKGV